MNEMLQRHRENEWRLLLGTPIGGSITDSINQLLDDCNRLRSANPESAAMARLKRINEDLQDRYVAAEKEKVELWNQVKWYEKQTGTIPNSAGHHLMGALCERGDHADACKQCGRNLKTQGSCGAVECR